MSDTSSGCTAAARASTAARSVPRADELVPGAVVLVDRDADDVPQRGQCVAVEVGDPVGAEELAHPEQQRRLGAGQDVGGLGGGVAGVQRHHHGAGVMGGQAGDHPVPGVRRPDRDPVAGLTPRSIIAAAARRTSSRSSAKVSVRSSVTSASWSAKSTADPVQHRGSGARGSHRLLVMRHRRP